MFNLKPLSTLTIEQSDLILVSASRSVEEERENCLRRRALGILFALGTSRQEAAEILRMALRLNAE